MIYLFVFLVYLTLCFICDLENDICDFLSGIIDFYCFLLFKFNFFLCIK